MTPAIWCLSLTIIGLTGIYLHLKDDQSIFGHTFVKAYGEKVGKMLYFGIYTLFIITGIIGFIAAASGAIPEEMSWAELIRDPGSLLAINLILLIDLILILNIMFVLSKKRD